MNNDTIKAVAEAISTVHIKNGHDRCYPPNYYLEPLNQVLTDDEVEDIAQAAIAAMQIREMTVDELAATLELAAPSWGTSKLYAKTLAKLGTIKIVGEV